jgi:hypothetical protein
MWCFVTRLFFSFCRIAELLGEEFVGESAAKDDAEVGDDVENDGEGDEEAVEEESEANLENAEPNVSVTESEALKLESSLQKRTNEALEADHPEKKIRESEEQEDVQPTVTA